MIWSLAPSLTSVALAVEATVGAAATPSNFQLAANIATILVALAAIATLAYLAKQTTGILIQARSSIEQLREYTQRSQLDLAYQMSMRFGDPKFNRHIFDAMKILEDGTLSKDKIMELFQDRNKPFRFDFRILSNFMEGLSYMYEQGHANRDVIWNTFYGIVIGYYKVAEGSGIIDGLREEYGKYGKGVLAKWEWLSKEFKRIGEPH